jgi:hypothetical protein
MHYVMLALTLYATGCGPVETQIKFPNIQYSSMRRCCERAGSRGALGRPAVDDRLSLRTVLVHRPARKDQPARFTHPSPRLPLQRFLDVP